MVIIQLTTDNRENSRQYHVATPWFGTAPEALLQGFSKLAGIKVHVISCTQRPVKAPEKLSENIWFHSLLVPKIGWMRTGYQGCIRRVRKVIRQIQPDIVHGQGTERDCGISAVLSGFPNVLTIHGNMRTIAKVTHARPFSFDWFAAKIEGFVIPRSDGIVCISKHARQAVTGAARRTWLVPNPVDARFFDIKRTSEPSPTILCVGNVLPVKNQNNFIRSLDSLAKTMKFRVIFLGAASGNDSYEKEFFQLLKERPWCTYEGFASREKLKAFLKNASLLALPSLEENCPMAVLEAMAASVPIVAARVGGVPDLIENEKTGFLCNPMDPQSVNTAVARIFNDLPFARQMAERAKISALKRFHPEIIAQEHTRIYQEVLSNNR